jgi:hypothetical protein
LLSVLTPGSVIHIALAVASGAVQHPSTRRPPIATQTPLADSALIPAWLVHSKLSARADGRHVVTFSSTIVCSIRTDKRQAFESYFDPSRGADMSALAAADRIATKFEIPCKDVQRCAQEFILELSMSPIEAG